MNDLAIEQALSIGAGEAQVRFPTVLDRLIFLRTLPNLGALAGNGLTYVATHAVERHHESGDLLYRPEEPVASVHFIVEGKVRVEQDGLHLLDGEPPFAIGFFPVLASSAVGQKATALEPTVTLEISQADLLEIFEDDFGFLENGIRQTSRQFVETQVQLEKRGLLTRSEPESSSYPSERLDLVQRLQLIRSGPFAEVNLEALVQLLRYSEELRLSPGDVLWEEGDAASWGVHLAHGVVVCSSADRTFRMGPGSVLGHTESNGGLPRSYQARAETRVVGVKQSTDTLLDVLEDNPTMALGVLSFLARAILDATVELARARASEPGN